MSKTKFTLNPNSHIEAAVFFHAPAGGPFFDIIVYDVTTNQQEILHVTGTKGWNILRKNITKNIQNARVSSHFFFAWIKTSNSFVIMLMYAFSDQDEC